MLLPRQRLRLARGAKDKEHAMSQQTNPSISVVGIKVQRNQQGPLTYFCTLGQLRARIF